MEHRLTQVLLVVASGCFDFQVSARQKNWAELSLLYLNGGDHCGRFVFLSSWVSATAGAEGGWIHRCEVIGGRILKAMTTTSYWPFEEGKLPHMSDFPRVIEVEPSSKIKIHMIKKFLNSILYWYLTAAKSFEVSKNNRPVPNEHPFIFSFG